MGRKRVHGDVRRASCFSAGARPTCSAAGACSWPGWDCSRSPRWPADSPRPRPMLIAARAVQGLGGAVIAPGLALDHHHDLPGGSRAQPRGRDLGRDGRSRRRGRRAARRSHHRPARAGGGSSSSTSRSGSGPRSWPSAHRRRAQPHAGSTTSTSPARSTATLGSRCSCSGSSAPTPRAGARARRSALIVAGLVLLVGFVGIEGRFAKRAADAAADLPLADAERRPTSSSCWSAAPRSGCGSSSRCTCSRCSATRRSRPAWRSCR